MFSALRSSVLAVLVGPVLLACGGGTKPRSPHAGAVDNVRASRGSAGAANAAASEQALDADTSYPDKTEVIYLSGKGTDDAIDWEFTINAGQKAGVPSTLPVPSNWEFHGFGTFQYGFNPSTEVGTYRRSFELPASWSRKRVFVVFEGSMTDTVVSVNGKSAGPVHQGAFYRFRYEVTDLVRPGSNQIEAVVSKQSSNASVNAAEREADYWTFGGIFRPVYLEAYPEQSIERFALDARADGSLIVKVLLRGLVSKGRITARVFDDGLAPVGTPLVATVAAHATEATLSGTFSGVQP
jgi:beta-galactosidase/beta-glucuronidase